MQTRLPQYDLSARNVMKKLGIEAVDLSDTPCCGPSVIRSVDYRMSSALSAQIMATARSRGVDAIVTLCPECFSSFVKVNTGIEEDAAFRTEVDNLLSSTSGLRYDGEIKVRHLLQVIHDEVGIKKLNEAATRKFEGLKAAVHPGCHFIRASTTHYADDPENPRLLDELVEGVGAKSVEWSLKLWCCGAPTLAFDRDASLGLGGKKLRSVKGSGADCVVTACPYCEMQFDSSQAMIERKLNEKFGIPAVLFTQLIGLSLGLAPEEVGLSMNRVNPKAVLSFMK